MKAVVTGATGLVGTHLVKQLIHSAYNFEKVLALGRNQSSLESLQRIGAEVASLDLINDAPFPPVLEDWRSGDTVWFHCAAAITGADNETLYKVNTLGTERLINFLEKGESKRLIHVSSVAVYSIVNHGPFNEFSKIMPHSQYGKTKLSQEELVTRSNLNWTIFRPPFIIGPKDLNVIPSFHARIEKKNMPNFSKKGKIGFVDARELAFWMISSASAEKTFQQIYNIQSQSYHLEDFIALFGELLGYNPPFGRKYPFWVARILGRLADLKIKALRQPRDRGLSSYRIRTLTMDRSLNITKIQEHLEFESSISLRDSLEDWIIAKRE